MNSLKKFNIKKILKPSRKGTLKKNIFFILFGMYFSTLAIAATLSVQFVGALIPGGNNNTPIGNTPKQQCRGNDTSNTLLINDRTTAPTDIEFDENGSFVFTSNKNMLGMRNNSISQNKLLENYQILSDAIRAGTFNCDHLKGADPKTQSGNKLGQKSQDIEIHQQGRLFFFLDDSQRLGKFTASKPYDLNTLTFETHLTLNGEENSIEFNRDGTKIFALDEADNSPTIATYQLPGAYDISSKTEIHKVDLYDLDIEDVAGEDEQGMDLEFNSDGSVLFVLIGNGDKEQEYIYHFDLAKNYDISTAVKAGRFHVGAIFMNRDAGDRFGDPSGFGFSRDGMNLYLLDNVGGTGTHQINQFKLDCPYGLVKCSSDSTSSIGSQVELAKQNITLNVSTIFKRFEWIKRNRDEEDLTSHNFNIDFPNPLLKSLAMSLEPKTKKTIASLVSANQKKDKKSKWSTWSFAELSMSDFVKLGFQKSKNIRTKGLTFGSDRKIGDTKFLGLAVRYADSKSNIRDSIQNTELESLTLNLYGIAPINENRYINAVLGLSALRFDSKYLGNLSGSRNGKQVFTSINYRTKNTFSGFNLTPTGKFTYGVTRLSEFTDFFSKAIDGSTKDIRYAEDTFKSGEFAAGFLFNVDKIKVEQGTFQPMGKVEILYDLTPNINYKYNYQGETPVNKDKIIGTYSKKSLKTNIGFEAIYKNGLTISPSYERIMTMNNDHRPGTRKENYFERFIIKVSRSKEEDGSQFALNIDPISESPSYLNYSKKYENFLINFTSNYSLFSKIPDYGANIEISGTF